MLCGFSLFQVSEQFPDDWSKGKKKSPSIYLDSLNLSLLTEDYTRPFLFIMSTFFISCIYYRQKNCGIERIRDTPKRTQQTSVRARQELRSIDSECMARISRARKVNSLSWCQVAVTHPSRCSGWMQLAIFKLLALYYMISKAIFSPQVFFSKIVME